MAFVDSLKKAIEIVKLNAKAIQEVAKDNTLTTHAFLILVIAGVASAVGQLNPLGLIVSPISVVVGQLIGVGILHLIASVLGGKGNYMQLFRASSFGGILSWVQIIPIIGPMVGSVLSLWLIIVHVVVLKNVYKLSTAKAVIAILIPIIIVLVLVFAFGAAFLATMFATQ